MNHYKPRQFIVLGALIALPLLMFGVAPTLLPGLIERIDALRGQVENLERENPKGKAPVETRQAEPSEREARVAPIAVESTADDLRFSDADGAEVSRVIDAALQGEVPIYLEERAVFARLDVAGILSTQAGDLDYSVEPDDVEPAVAADLVYDAADLGLSPPQTVPFTVAPAASEH